MSNPRESIFFHHFSFKTKTILFNPIFRDAIDCFLIKQKKKIGRTIGRNIPREKGISLIQFAENENEHKNLSSYYANICGHRRLPPARKLYFIFRKTMIMMLSSSGSQSPPSLVRNLKKNSASAAPFNSIEDRMGKK